MFHFGPILRSQLANDPTPFNDGVPAYVHDHLSDLIGNTDLGTFTSPQGVVSISDADQSLLNHLENIGAAVLPHRRQRPLQCGPSARLFLRLHRARRIGPILRRLCPSQFLRTRHSGDALRGPGTSLVAVLGRSDDFRPGALAAPAVSVIGADHGCQATTPDAIRILNGFSRTSPPHPPGFSRRRRNRQGAGTGASAAPSRPTSSYLWPTSCALKASPVMATRW